MAKRRRRRRIENPEVVLGKLRAVRALWVGGHATARPIEEIAVEFYYAVGDLLEGVPLEKVVSTFKSIDGKEVLAEAESSE